VRTQLLSVSRGGHGSGVPEPTPAGFCVFLSDPDPESKFCEKPDPEPMFTFGSSGSVRGHYEVKTWLYFGWIVGNRSLDRTLILKYDDFPDPDSKFLEQERSRILKK